MYLVVGKDRGTVIKTLEKTESGFCYVVYNRVSCLFLPCITWRSVKCLLTSDSIFILFLKLCIDLLPLATDGD